MEKIRRQLRKHRNTNVPLNPDMLAHMDDLAALCANPTVESAFNEAVAHTSKLTSMGTENYWQYANIQDFQNYFGAWFTDLELPDGGLGLIFPFTWFYLNNTSGYYFLNTFSSKTGGAKRFSKEIFDWTVKFIFIRGEFMDSEVSTLNVQDWMDDPNSQMDDFIVPEGGYKSFNEFFSRELNLDNKPRPIANPTNPSIVAASADTIINFILSDLRLQTRMDVKGRQISVTDLLDGSKLAKKFIGGTAVSCVLMPNVYHHYHSPVDGKVVESREVPGIYNGVMDGEHWLNNGDNPGESDTDFSIFEDFHRAFYIIETEQFGHVAIIPVGLNTISRIRPTLVNGQNNYVKYGDAPIDVKKGTKLGYFQYGGSLNILLFERGVFGNVSLLMGNRLGQMIPKQPVVIPI